jgi:hypothetical protein
MQSIALQKGDYRPSIFNVKISLPDSRWTSGLPLTLIDGDTYNS